MKTLFRYSYLIILAALTAVMAACSSDEDVASGEQRADGKVPVRLHLRVAGQGTSQPDTRATWKDTNATDDEMMNIWTVYCVDNDPTSDRFGKLVFIHICMPIDDNREIDDLVYLPKGKYAFYSFANIHPTVSNGYIMGIPYDLKKLRPVNNDGSLGDEVDFYFGEYPDPENSENVVWRDFFEISDNNPHKGVVYDMKWAESPESDTYEFKYHDYYDTFDIGMYPSLVNVLDGFKGNGLDLTAKNCFSSKGIPMSNYQEIEITENTNVDLIVVRMVAKIELQLTNESSSNIKVKSATLSDITEDGSGQIGIFPNLNNVGTATQNQMSFTHKDIRPHLDEEATVGSYTHPINKTIDAGATETVTFYVNESATPTNASGLFFLTLELENGSLSEYRHALINQKGSTSNDDNAWDYIARNDYRIIPVVLTDWQLRIEPIAFAPIAGYPATTLSSDALTATFSTGGIIALQPYVKKRSDSTWRDFSNPEITYGGTSWETSISWKNSDGINESGEGKIVKTPFTYDSTSHCIIGELNNDLDSGIYKTSITVTLKLGPSGSQYTYSYTCNVVLQK